MTDVETCTICPRTRAEHRVAEAEQVVHHKFAGPGGGLTPLSGDLKGKKELPGSVVRPTGLAGDPVLRTILIEKGVISIEDLEKAERTLNATGILRTHGNSTG